MTQNKEVSIDDKNEVIGVFMGYKMYNKRYPRNHGIGAPESEPEKCMIIQKAKYHSDWNQLMPVWIKFRNLSIDSKEYSEWLSSLYWYLYCADEPKTFFERLYYAITWYNTTHK